MSAIGTVVSVAQGLSAAIESPVFKEICSIFGYRSELESLKNTVSTARAVLLDAQSKQDHELSIEAHNYIEKLKYAVYDADDLLDKFATLAAQKQQLEGGKFSKEVRAFFSRFNQLGVAYTMSRGIKDIRKTLDAITRDHAKFGIGLGSTEPVRRRNRETCSYVYEHNIIGREGDKKVVIDILLDTNVKTNVSFVTIVGIGGLGKTAFAQLVYKDKDIESAFPLRMWVCISDQDPKHLDITAVLLKILKEATKKKPESSDLELVQEKVRKELGGKKYLLVLDDVWIEDRDQCLTLGEFLMGGAKGSRILVTTRSQITAKVIGSGSTHVLQGLSPYNSWHLFERLAFEQGQANPDPDLVEIGKQIVKKCANVPLAIRMMGTLLYGKRKTEWEEIQKKELSKIRKNDNQITDVLKLSYYHLATHLKSCFSYCAVFPKDYVMDKMKLVSLWIAQGYLEPLDESQSLINAGEECFSILLGRCFFQDVETDDYGEIVSCKMHDLMHDIAQAVVGNEICNAYSITSNKNKQTRHVFTAEQEYAKSSFLCTKIRTYLKDGYWTSPPMNDLLKKWKYLRALDLQNPDFKKLPCEIGRLLHLRYLNLSHNRSLERLPEDFTKLYNLQTLLLRECWNLKELPSDLSKLVQLRVLDIERCRELRYMPCGLDKLTGLRILPLFVVGEVKSSKKKQGVGRLEDIAALDELKGKLIIKIHDNSKAYEKRHDKGEFLKRKKHINEIDLEWLHDGNDENKGVSDKAVAEELEPNENLKRLRVSGYRDVEKPSWAIDDTLQTSLPNLVKLEFSDCKGLEDIPMVGRLRFLKSLFIGGLVNLEYMEKGSSSCYVGDEASSGTRLGLFASLKVLDLYALPKLKGWWRGDGHMDDEDDNRSHMSISFPHLCELSIVDCPLLTSMPLCPTVETLSLYGFNERLKIVKIKGGGGVEDGDIDTPQPKLSCVYTDDVGYLVKSLPIPAAFQCLSRMEISEDKKVENLSEVEQVFQSCSSSLLELDIESCREVKSISGGLKHLTALQTLTLLIEDDKKNEEKIRTRLEEEDEIPWNSLQHSLHDLDINYMPRGIRHLTSLQSLIIRDASHVKTIPEWFTCLSSLHYLQIWHSSAELRQRCQSPNGADWTKIQHIPIIHFIGTDGVGFPISR